MKLQAVSSLHGCQAMICRSWRWRIFWHSWPRVHRILFVELYVEDQRQTLFEWTHQCFASLWRVIWVYQSDGMMGAFVALLFVLPVSHTVATLEEKLPANLPCQSMLGSAEGTRCLKRRAVSSKQRSVSGFAHNRWCGVRMVSWCKLLGYDLCWCQACRRNIHGTCTGLVWKNRWSRRFALVMQLYKGWQ